jgi:hypothetical protein
MVVKLNGASVDVIQHVEILGGRQRQGKTNRLLLLDETGTTTNHTAYVMTKIPDSIRFEILGFD